MNDKKQNRPGGNEIAADILNGATAALSYTDEEIREALPPHEAQEFIDLRNRVLNDIESSGSTYGSDESELPLAAEEVAPYK